MTDFMNEMMESWNDDDDDDGMMTRESIQVWVDFLCWMNGEIMVIW